MIFDQEWFVKHQNLLLWFANTKYGRDVLCINGNRSAVNTNKIARITPNAIYWRGEDNKRRAEFRTTWKFSNRLFYEYQTIWKAFHWFDQNVANVYVPLMNLGCDTLTVYPDPGTGGDTVDGWVEHVAYSDWADLIAGPGTGVNNPNDATLTALSITTYGATPGQWTRYRRRATLFDTSGIGAANIVTDATFSLHILSSFTNTFTTNTFKWTVVTSSPASNGGLVTSDFLNFGDIPLTEKKVADSGDIATSGYTDFPFNSSGKQIVSTTGITKLGCRESEYDIADIEPNWEDGKGFLFYASSASSSGTANDPKLVVTFGPPALPTVVTTIVTSRSATRFSAGGNITDTGGVNATERGLAYGTTSSPTTPKTTESGSFDTGAYSTDVQALQPKTKYYYRAFATNTTGTSYGNDLTVHTMPKDRINILDGNQ